MADPTDEFLDAERPVDVTEDLDPEAPSDALLIDVPDDEREEPAAEVPLAAPGPDG